MENYYILILLFLTSALSDYCELAYLWQLKEYRLDRFRDFLGTILGKKFILSYKIILRPVLFLALILGWPSTSILVFIFGLDLLDSLVKFIRHRFSRPKPTAKAVLIIAASILAEGVILLVASKAALILILAASRFFIIDLAVLVINFLTYPVKKYYYKQAAKKLARQKNLTVIGVTGSYGKTTVKNFLEQMLKRKYQVIKTPKNVNSELGVARFILKTDFDQADVFIVEMGAYKTGEIKLVCGMVKPRIGILTAINEQHLSLFGSIKNTQTAKYELLRSLPETGLAIINSDNAYCREFIPKLKCEIKTFGQLEEFKPDCLITNISASADHLEFQAAPNYKIKTKIIGAHNAMNIASVILAAEYLGLSKSEIEEQAGQFALPEATMQIVKYASSMVIDDSYNASPEAFAAALKFLADYQVSGKKIVISRGMIELGQASQEAHKKIGGLIGKIANEFIITSPDSVAALKSGVGNAKLKIQTIFSPAKLLKHLKQNQNQPNLILLEGRMPEIIKREIKTD